MARDHVRLEGIEKSYGAVTALQRIDLSVRKGEFLTLLGPSGSGKTTILNVIAGTITPGSGRVFIGERDVTLVPPNQRRLGMVFQNYALMPHMTIFDNIAFPLRIRRLAQAEIKRKVADVLELVQLPDVGTRRPKELSGGQQQRIAIARCLVYDPEIILMDEPLGALDKKLRDQMKLEIKRLHSKVGATILYVTHDQEEALAMSDRICLMNRGRIEQLGPPNDLYFKPQTTFAADFLGESNIFPATADGGHVRTAGGIVIDSLDGGTPSGPFKIMIRPENIALLEDGEMAACTVDGVLEELVFVGPVTNFRLGLADGAVLTAKRLTQPEHLAMTAGRKVRAGWKTRDVVALRD